MLITLQLMPIFHDNNRIFVLFPGYSCSGEPCNRCREIINTECKEEVSQYGEMTLHLLLVQTKPQKVCSLWCNGIESVVGKKYVGSVVICTACEMAIVWIENQLRETKRRSWYCNMLTRSLLPLWFALTFLWCNSERVSWWLDFCIASLFCETIHNSAWPPPTSCSPAWTLFLSKWYACLHR